MNEKNVMHRLLIRGECREVELDSAALAFASAVFGTNNEPAHDIRRVRDAIAAYLLHLDAQDEETMGALVKAGLRLQVGTMPQRPPMAVLEAIVLERRLETHARGKDVQRRYGVDVVPPNYELEHAAGLYDLIRETLLEFVACNKQEDAK